MTEPTPQKKSKRNLAFAIALGVVALAFAGFLASRAGIDKALMKQQLDAFIAKASQQAATKGANLQISYEGLEVKGRFAGRHVVVLNPVLTMKPLDREARPASPGQFIGDSIRVTTPAVEIYPNKMDLSSLEIRFPEPLNLAGEEAPEKSLLKLTSNVPSVVVVGQRQDGGIQFQEWEYKAPPQTTLTYLRETQAQGEEDKTPALVPVYETFNVTLAEGSRIASSLATNDSTVGNVTVDLRDLVMTSSQAPKATLKAPEIKAQWSNQNNLMKATMQVGPITSDDAEMPYQPLSLTLDATYEGVARGAPAAEGGAAASNETRMVLKTLSFSTKDASLNATANFSATPTDTMPVGSANIAVSNLPYVMAELRTFGVLDEKSEPLVTAVLEKITGKPIAELKDVAVPIERVRDGAFKIGNSSFEELFAVLLGGALKTAAPVPQLPDADKPRSEAIPVPDPSVRG